MNKNMVRNEFAFGAYLELTKPRILMLVLVTTVIGYYLGARGIASWTALFYTLIGTGLSAGGAGTLNHYLERSVDANMERTKNRPLPSGKIEPASAMVFGILLVLSGCGLLLWKINLLTAFLALLTTFLYALVYTPMKRHSWLNTTVGAIPGALPIMGGWTAATNNIDPGAWVVFAIMFIWQHPHFYSIAWMFRDDYKQAGFKMLPSFDSDGSRTTRQIIGFLILLLPVSVLPVALGISGNIYLVGSILAGIAFLGSAIPFIRDHSRQKALVILKSSVFYLPVILALIVIDLR